MQREVIKWTQSLDLSFPIKNPRKDLANGFIVAEILSRYDKDVSMHSIGTEMAMQRRLDNWQQIQRVLDRLKCATVTKELVEGTIQQKGMMARDLLDQLYMFLTKRQLKANVIAPPVKTQLEQPGFTRPTAAALLREANDATKVRLQQATGQIDEEKIRLGNESLLQKHTVTLQSLKLAEPERYQPRKPSNQGYAAMNSTRRLGGDTSVEKSRDRARPAAKEVEVRGLDENILHTFAERDQKAKEEALRLGFSKEDTLCTALSKVVHKPLSSFGLLQDLDDLLPQSPVGTEYFLKFVTLRHRIPVQIRGQCWAFVHDAAKNIAKHVQLRTEEMTHLLLLLQFAFGKDTAMLSSLNATARDAVGVQDGEPAAALYDVEQAFALLIAVGKHLVSLAPETASAVLEAHLLPQLLPLILTGNSVVMETVASVLTSFVHHHHLDGIRRLASNIEALLKENETSTSRERCIGLIAHVLRRIDFSHCNGADVIARYYAAEGFALSTVARGAAVLLATQSAEIDVMETSVFVPVIQRLARDGSWEVRLLALQFLLVFHRMVLEEDENGSQSSSKRKRQSTYDDDEDSEAREAEAQAREARLEALVESLSSVRESVVQIIASFDGTGASSSQRAAALAAASRHLSNDFSSVEEIGRILIPRLAVEAKDHKFLQSSHGGTDEATTGRVQSAYAIGGLNKFWNRKGIAQSLIVYLETLPEELSTLQVVQLTEALCLGVRNMTEEEEFWQSVLLAVRETLITAATNPGECHGVATADLQLCQETALNAAAKFYLDLSGEGPQSLTPRADGDVSGIESQLAEFHTKALEWIQQI